MNGVRVRHTGYRIIVLFGMLFATGCTTTYKIDSDPAMDYTAHNKIDLRIQLHMSDGFSGYMWEHKMALGDTSRMGMGPALSSNAEAMATGLFRDVVVSRGSSDSPPGGVDAVLTPRVVSVERAMGTTAFSDMKTIIDLEWTLADAEGNLIWVDTIQGVGKAKTGNLFTHRSEARKQGNRAIQDVFQKSVEAIMSSPEIQAFVKSRRITGSGSVIRFGNSQMLDVVRWISRDTILNSRPK